MKQFRKLGIFAAAAATAIGLGASPARAEPQPGQYSKYVALGDSFASAGSLTKFDFSKPIQCGASTDDYPHQLAGRLGLNGPGQFDDAACGFAGRTITGDPKISQFHSSIRVHRLMP